MARINYNFKWRWAEFICNNTLHQRGTVSSFSPMHMLINVFLQWIEIWIQLLLFCEPPQTRSFNIFLLWLHCIAALSPLFAFSQYCWAFLYCIPLVYSQVALQLYHTWPSIGEMNIYNLISQPGHLYFTGPKVSFYSDLSFFPWTEIKECTAGFLLDLMLLMLSWVHEKRSDALQSNWRQ